MSKYIADPVYFIGSLPSSIDYCGWTVINAEHDYDWGCGNGAFCEAFANDSNGECVYVNTNITDVVGIYVELSFEYMYCCDGDNCNHVDIDISTCKYSADLENFYGEFWKCLYSEDSVYWQLGNSDNVDVSGCVVLLDFFKAEADCYCNGYSDIYGRVSSETQTLLKTDVMYLMELYSQFNEVLGCDIKLVCDLVTGRVMSENGTTSGVVMVTEQMTTNKPTSDYSSGSEMLSVYIVGAFFIYVLS